MKIKFSTVIVDLKRSEEEIYTNFGKHTKKSIKKAIKEKLFIEESKEIKEFYKRYLKFYETKKLTPSSFEEVKEENIALLFCKYKKKIVGGLVLQLNYSKEYPAAFLNFSYENYWKSCPNDILYWEAIKWSKRNGYKIFDMGGCSLKPRKNEVGITIFKRKYGEIFEYEKEVSKYFYFKYKLVNSWIVFYKINNLLKNIRNNMKGVYQNVPN